MMGVPTFYTRLLQHPGLTRDATKHMRLFISGSAPLLAETHREWSARTGHAILERYGMTETNMNTSNPYDGDRVAGTVGFPAAGRRCASPIPRPRRFSRGRDRHDRGEGPERLQGLLAHAGEDGGGIPSDGFFITGDLGKIDARGYVHIVGRGKDLVITGGFNVYPKEVESEIDALPGVVEAPSSACRTRISARASRRRRAREGREQSDESATSPMRSTGAGWRNSRPMPKRRDLRRRPAAQHHGQGAEERAARATHILEVAEKLADRIGIIRDGRLIAEGTLAELQAQAGPSRATLEDVFLRLTREAA
jgi:hypothetical protein